MIRHDCRQMTLEWAMLHLGIPTASQFDRIVTPLFARRSGEMPKTYLAQKLAERWQGFPLPSFSSIPTELGQILETEAIPWYEFEFNCTIDRPGFITTDDGRLGCSPDGLLGQDSGIEIKCPNAETHIKYLMQAKVPDDYVAQVHGCMLVTGRPEWKFVSYRRGFPALVLTVKRDDGIQHKLSEALTFFLNDFDQAMDYLIDLNGGPPAPPPVQPVTSEPVRFSWEMSQDDVPTP